MGKSTPKLYTNRSEQENDLYISRNRCGVRWFGSKRNILDEIYSLIPHHDYFIDVFGGGANVILNKKPVNTEIYNDIYGDIVNFFRVLRDNPDELIDKVFLSPVSREEYFEYIYNPSDEPIERARQFIVAHYSTFLTLTHKTPGRFMISKHPVSSTNPQVPIENLIAMAKRLKNVVIENRPALDIISMYDTKEAFLYIDPPYPLDARSGGVGYKDEMTRDEHIKLRDALSSVKGKFLISTYDNEFYDELYKDYEKIVIKSVSSGARFKTKEVGLGENKYRTEVVYVNYKTKSGFFS